MTRLRRIGFLAALLLMFAPAQLRACALCMQYDPTVHVDIGVVVAEDRIERLDITWLFSPVFTRSSIQQYDDNRNGGMDSGEFAVAEAEFRDQLEQSGFHTRLMTSAGFVVPEVRIPEDGLLALEDERLQLRYAISVEQSLIDSPEVRLEFLDRERFYGFFPSPERTRVLGTDAWAIGAQSDLYAPDIALVLVRVDSATDQVPVEPQVPDVVNSAGAGVFMQLALLLDDVLEQIRQSLQGIQSGGLAAWAMLGFFSLAYGAVHALGPGHGKTLVASYMFSGRRSFGAGWMMAGAIGLIHVLSACGLTLVSVEIANQLVRRGSAAVEGLVEGIAGLLILAIAGWMLVGRVRRIRAQHHRHGCACHGCRAELRPAGSFRADLLVALGAGVVPCPGTVLVLLTLFALGAFGAGLFAALAMSLGMSLVIGLSAMLSIGARRHLEVRGERAMLWFEVLALGVVVLIGAGMAAALLL